MLFLSTNSNSRPLSPLKTSKIIEIEALSAENEQIYEKGFFGTIKKLNCVEFPETL